jgi:hypothetical protein
MDVAVESGKLYDTYGEGAFEHCRANENSSSTLNNSEVCMASVGIPGKQKQFKIIDESILEKH